MTTILETRNLTKLYGVVIGVNDMTFELGPGIHGLLGPNGAGKSTLMKLITAQLRPSEGSVHVLGETPWNNPGIFRKVGFCPEYDAFYDFMSAFEFVHALARLSGFDAPTAKKKTERALELCSATEFMHRPIRTYSKGMRQRTKVAQAIVHEPDFLLLDEPMSGTDPVGRHELTELVKSLGASGTSILIASHVLHEVEAMTENFLLIYGGRVLATGDVHEIRSLMDQHPHRIQIRCSPEHTRPLAERMIERLSVTGLELDETAGTLDVATKSPEAFYHGLPEVALDIEATIHEMTSRDDSLEAVFKYLVGVH